MKLGTMEFLLYCILAIGSNVVMGFPGGRPMVQQVQLEFKNFKKNLLHNDVMLHTPLINETKTCCTPSVLKCFAKGLPQLPVSSNGRKVKTALHKNLQKKVVGDSVRDCSVDETKTADCHECESYDKRSSKEFIDALETLLQMTLLRLS